MSKIQNDKQPLENYRQQLDQIDQQWIELLAQRFAITEKVGLLKKKQQLDATDAKREQQQMLKIEQQAQKASINPKLAQDILRLIIDEVVQNHERIQQQGIKPIYSLAILQNLRSTSGLRSKRHEIKRAK